ncbi:hypothetical protein BOX24_09610 [Leptospirillum ferriphilum]|uniref:Uncharacterized protein n=1 Tax=Leptospirillum ferriphilum TaxID=178606 RepID=A0A1V3SU14_9BACT|nr:hypothetical protein ABH19_07325 [Leptospirillum sp. Group II 'CF-1']OOH71274.1 hypothetical protein BOX24_09610 [Leptospirillum ferriphilum]
MRIFQCPIGIPGEKRPLKRLPELSDCHWAPLPGRFYQWVILTFPGQKNIYKSIISKKKNLF